MARSKGQGRARSRLRGRVASRQNIRADLFESKLALALQHEEAGRGEKAEAIYRRILEDDANHFGANIQLAKLLTGAENYELATELWRKAVELNKVDLNAQFNLAHGLHKLGRLDEAVNHYQQGLRTRKSRKIKIPRATLAQIYYQLAHVYKDLWRDDEAERYLRHSINADQRFIHAHNLLGDLRIQQGRVEEATASFRRVIEIQPDFAAAYRSLAFAKKFTEHDDDVKKMETIYESTTVSDVQRMQLAFGLGKAFEDLKKPKKAFAYWLEGNRLMRKLHPYKVSGDIWLLKLMRKTFDSAYIGKESAQIAGEITPIFIVSMPRAGSSLTEQILAVTRPFLGVVK